MRQTLAFRPVHTSVIWAILIIILVWLPACNKKQPSDSLCVVSPVPGGIEVETGKGSLIIDGTTDTYFYIFDESGKQLSYQSLGKPLDLDPGEYQVKVNNTSHQVNIQKGMLTRCGTGTLMVTGTTEEYYYVFDSLKQQLFYDKLGKSSSFFPSVLLVKVNNTQTRVEIKLNAVTETKSGTLTVHGVTDEYYYVFDIMGNQLNYTKLNAPLAFLPGSYVAKVNSTEIKADILENQLTEQYTGTLTVTGLTDEYFYVFNPEGKQLNYQKLNKSLAFFPGTYKIKVNSSEVTGEITKDENAKFDTGSLVVPGNGETYYYVFDKTGNQLNYNAVNKPLSFFPSEYSVKFNQTTQLATVSKGQETSVRF